MLGAGGGMIRNDDYFYEVVATNVRTRCAVKGVGVIDTPATEPY